MNHWISKYWAWIVAALAVVALSSAVYFLSLDSWINASGGWTEAPVPFGVAAFALVYALTTVLLIPGALRTIAAGMIFDVALGTLAAWSGAVLGASLAFLVGRHIARFRILQMTKSNAKFQAIDHAICEDDWKIIGLMRLSPLIPFNISNYFYGVTNVRFWPYVLASAGGMLPGTLFYVYLGAAGKAGLSAGEIPHHPFQYAFFGVGLLATIGLMIWVSRLAKQALKVSGAAEDGARK